LTAFRAGADFAAFVRGRAGAALAARVPPERRRDEAAGAGFADREGLATGLTVRAGAFPEKTNLDTFKKKGIVRFTHIGVDAIGQNQATDIKPNKTVNPLSYHTEDKVPYPSYARRIQFYIDHEWFIEAGEQLPVHKPTPRMGGNYPLSMTSGHQRWSIHSMWVVNKTLSHTHRGQPTLYMNPADMEARSIVDDEEVFVHARDPYKRVDILNSTRHVRVVIGGQTVAETRRPALLFETSLPTRYYIPPEDVRMDLLEPSNAETRCPYKGKASYWSYPGGDRVERNIVWTYEEPIPDAAKIKGRLSFFNERVDIYVDGELQPRPRTPWSREG
jgi:uncharacterized protein (DUF427 family)